MYDNTSPRYQVVTYRDQETIQKENTLDSFVIFLKLNSEDEPSEADMIRIQKWITEFLGYDIHRVEAGEKSMLTRWQESVK